MFRNILVVQDSLRRAYHMIGAVQVVVVSTMVAGALSRCALLHSACDLKAAQMNERRSLFRGPIVSQKPKKKKKEKKLLWER